LNQRFTLLAGDRAAIAALLLAAALVLAGCAGTVEEHGDAEAPVAGEEQRTPEQEAAPEEESAEGESPYQDRINAVSERATPNPESLQGGPEPRDWNDAESGNEVPNTAQFFNTGGSAGAIPAVKPFNFGRDPGGPEDKTLYLTVPKIGLEDVQVINSTSDEALTESTVHVPATGFPWQAGANTYIAGHRIGYPGTGSHEIFYDLDKLAYGDEIIIRDSAGNEYVYRVFDTLVTDPFDVEVMNPVEGKEVVTLQTCTLPDYAERLVVQGELVEGELIS
jgi:sortase A